LWQIEPKKGKRALSESAFLDFGTERIAEHGGFRTGKQTAPWAVRGKSITFPEKRKKLWAFVML
jgi:hypothetical protein